jgi:virginiamycin B lyase
LKKYRFRFMLDRGLEEGAMRTVSRVLAAGVGVAALLALSGLQPAAAQGAAALSGVVSSAEEGAMEGVVVSAKKDGSTVTISVVTDATGHYSFPAARLAPGHYALAIRAVGYDLDGPRAADVAAGQDGAADLKLRKTRNLAGQLSNAEWLASIPGTDPQKKFLLNCVGCHTLQRIVTSTHNAEEFKQVITRMTGYYPGSTPIHPQRLVGDFRRDIGNGANFDTVAAYLASINLSEGTSFEYPLKTMPRATGRGTHVVVTEYDLPRPTIEPHDVIRDGDGVVWFSNFGEQTLGRLDPATGAVREFTIPELKPGSPKGTLDLEAGSDGNLWIALMFQAGIARFDKKSETFQLWSLPAAWQADGTQLSMVSPGHAAVDGKVWTKDVETNKVFRLDPATGEFENLGVAKTAAGKSIGAYGIPTDAENNLYMLNFGGAEIGRLDAKTKTLAIYPTMIPASRPRRGRVDAQDRLWFAEYAGNAVALFDPATTEIKEWPAPTAWSAPYDISPAGTGEVWTASMLTDRVLRLDPKSGTYVEYPLPRQTNIRRVFADGANAVWFGSVHGASIVKLEPLD